MNGTLTIANPSVLEREADPSWLKWAILFSASLGALLEIVDTSIVNVALNEMQASLGATLTEIGWVVTIYSIANVIMLPMTAWLGDRFGSKQYFIFSLVSFTAASVLCGVSQSLGMLIFARFLQGLGGGGLLAKAQAILFKTFRRDQQAVAQAVFGMVVIAGPAVGPVIGGYIVTALNWRWIFFVNLPIGIVATMMCAAFLKHEDPTKEALEAKVDWLGIALLCFAVGCLQTFLEQGQQNDWFASSFISALGVGAVLGTFFLLWREFTVDNPIIDFRVLRHRSLAAGSVMGMVLGMGLYGALFAVPIFCQAILGFTAQQTGIVLAPSAVIAILTFPVIAKLSGKIDARILISIGSLITILAMFHMLQHISPPERHRGPVPGLRCWSAASGPASCSCPSRWRRCRRFRRKTSRPPAASSTSRASWAAASASPSSPPCSPRETRSTATCWSKSSRQRAPTPPIGCRSSRAASSPRASTA